MSHPKEEAGEPERRDGWQKIYDLLAEEGGGTWATYVMMDIDALLSAPPHPSGNAAAQIERLAVLRKLDANHGGEGESAPDQASVDAAIAFIRRWGLPDNTITTLADNGHAVIELHGDNYADITFVPAPTAAPMPMFIMCESCGSMVDDTQVCDCTKMGVETQRLIGLYRGAPPAPADTEIREALKKAELALCDWANTYAPDECKPETVAAARARLREGGTLAYIADALGAIRAVLNGGKHGQ